MNARQIMSGLGWSALSTAVAAACQLVFMAVLARLLEPAAFGLMAMAGIALRFAGFFAQMGFSQAIVQKSRIDPEDTTAALLMCLGIGTLLYGAMVLAAPLFAHGFRAPELASLIEVLGVSLVLGALGSLPIALLRRQARFKRVNAVEVTSFVVGYGAVGIGCASAGLGVWSLVAATLAQQTLLLVLAFLAVRYPLAWPLRGSAFKALWAFGSRYSLIGFLEFVSANVEMLYIGRWLGKVELGLFNRSMMLVSLPVEIGVSAVNKVLFPALAGMQNDRDRVADGFQILLLGIGLFSTAVGCGIAAAAPDVVAVLFGAKWAGIAPLVTILALAVPPTFMYVACGVTLDSLAELRPKLRLQTAMLLLRIALVAALAGWGLTGVAWAVVLSETVRLAFGLGLLKRRLGLAPARLGWLVALFVATGLAVATAVGLAASLGAGLGLVPVARVAIETIAGGVTLALVLLLLARQFPGYPPLQRFDALRGWHRQFLQVLQIRAAHP